MNLLTIVESTPGLYYSYETDITVKYVQAVLLHLFFVQPFSWLCTLPILLVSRHLNMFISLQRRCNLANGWMSKPVWKQVCLLTIFELFHNIKLVELYIIASNWHVNTYSGGCKFSGPTYEGFTLIGWLAWCIKLSTKPMEDRKEKEGK